MSEYPFTFPVLDRITIVVRRYVWLSYFIYIFLVILWFIQYIRVKKDYSNSFKRSKLNSILTLTSYHLYSLLIIYTAWCNLWAYSQNFTIAYVSFVIGSLIGGISSLYYLIVLVNLKSLKKMIGLDTEELITSGTFKKSRNPESLTKGVAQLGVAIMGRSIFAIIISLIWWLLNHLYILEEEKLLEQLFGDKYLGYCSETPRYLNFRRNNNN